MTQDPVPERIIKKLRIKNPDAVPAHLLDRIVNECLTAYENSGYPFARISVDSARLDAGTVRAALMISTGEQIRIDSVLNRTRFNISQRILSRILDLHPGDVYREKSIAKAGARLSSLPFVREKRSLEAGFHDSKVSVFVYPEKVPSSRFDGWIGLSPGTTGSFLSIAGAVELGLDNILGQAENWFLNWKRNQDKSQKMTLSSSFPYFVGLPFGLQNNFDLFRQDTSYLNIEWMSSIPYHFSPVHTLDLFYRYRRGSLLSGPADSQPVSRKPYTLWLTGLNWRFNMLDNQLNPSRGLAFRIEASTGSKKVDLEPDPGSHTEFQMNLSVFYPVYKKLILNAKFRTGSRISTIMLDNELFMIGGMEDLRGFDEDLFRAARFFVSTYEIRYLLDNYSNLLVFADLGGLGNQKDVSWFSRYPFGFGVGGQIRTAGGVFKLVFALGKEPDKGLNIGSSKIHLGYVGIF
jgi:outer membrane protein assembly factor BamA